MSYDLFLHDHPDRQVADRLLSEIAFADPPASDAQWVTFRALRRSHHLGLSNSSMMAVVAVMDALAMTSSVPAPPLPSPREFGADPDDEVTWDPGAGVPDAAQRRFQAANEQVLRCGAEVPGIPRAKFFSNDGWWVTPIELASALGSYEQQDPAALDAAIAATAAREALDPGELRTVWAAWLELCRAGVDHGGVRVW